MDKKLPTYPRILAIVPSPSGFGLAVIEGVNALVGWEVKRVREDLNNGCISKIEKAIDFYEPHVVVMEDGSQRSSRVRALMKRTIALARKRGVHVAVLSRAQVRQNFFPESLGNKDELAAIVAERFPEELGQDLPPKRREWMSEDHRISMFMAVAIALAFRRFHKTAPRMES
jgi:hypothetical protein